MVHVGMGYKDMTYFEDVFGCQAINVAEIENYGAILKLKGNEKSGVIKGTVDQSGMKTGTHYCGKNFFTCSLMV
jgi:hypothetical protein